MKQIKIDSAQNPSVSKMSPDLLAKYSDDFQKEILPDDELLISWLDGELNDQERLLLEKKVAESPDLHKRMEELRETWELLNTLKTDPVSPRLASSTMEMVALCADRECQTRKKRILQKRWIFFIGIGLFLLGSLLTARFATNIFINRSQAHIEQMTPFLVRLDQLETIGDYDFLVSLTDSALFRDYSPNKTGSAHFPNQADNKAIGTDHSKTDNKADEKTTAKETSVGSSSETRLKNEYPLKASEESSTEQSAWNDPNFQRLVIKYHHLSSSKKKDLAELYQKIENSPQRNVLFKTAENYYCWLTAELHEWQRDAIIYASDNDRLEQIKKCLKETKNRLDRSETQEPFSGKNTSRPQSFLPPFSMDMPSNPNGLSERPLPAAEEMPPAPAFPNHFEKGENRNSDHNFDPRNSQKINHSDSKMYPFFGKNSNVWNNLPEELRKEDLSSFFESFDKYVNERMKSLMQKKDGRSKIDQSKTDRPGTGHPPWRGGFRLINDFISSQPIDVFLAKLSPSARTYIEKLPEKERKPVLGLLFTFNLYGRWCPDSREQQNRNYSNGDKRDFPSANFHDPFKKGAQFNNTANTRFNGAFWMNESTGELAETLRRLPQEKQDELLSLPSDEMYAQLLILHWGFDPKKVRKKTEEILPGTLPR